MGSNSEKNNLIIFSNSVGLCSIPKKLDDKSYIDMLQKEYNVTGIQATGLTIFDAKKYLSNFFTGHRENLVVILNLGVCECTSTSPIQFLAMATHYLLTLYDNHHFKSFVFCKMRKVAHSIAGEGANGLHLPLLYPEEFINIYEELLIYLQGTKVLCLGMVRSNSMHKGDNSIKVNTLLKNLVESYGQNFVDLYNIAPECVTDNTHYNAEGHKKVYTIIKNTIEK